MESADCYGARHAYLSGMRVVRNLCPLHLAGVRGLAEMVLDLRRVSDHLAAPKVMS